MGRSFIKGSVSKDRETFKTEYNDNLTKYRRKISKDVSTIKFDVNKFTTQMVANIFGVDVTTVSRNWINGNCPRNVDGTFNIQKVVNWHLEREIHNRFGSKKDPVKSQKELKQTEKLTLEIMKLKDQVVKTEDVQLVMHQQMIALKEYFTNAFRLNTFELMTKLNVKAENEEIFKTEWESFVKGLVNTFVKTGESDGLYFSE